VQLGCPPFSQSASPRSVGETKRDLVLIISPLNSTQSSHQCLERIPTTARFVFSGFSFISRPGLSSNNGICKKTTKLPNVM